MLEQPGVIEQQGKVVSLSNGRACVRLGGTSGCSRCDAGRGCGAGIFGRLLKQRPVMLELENSANAEPDQAVMVGIPEALFLSLVARLYLFPLLAAIAAAALGYYLSVISGSAAFASDMITLVCGIAGGAVMVLRNRNVSREFNGSFIVHLLRVIEIHEPGN